VSSAALVPCVYDVYSDKPSGLESASDAAVSGVLSDAPVSQRTTNKTDDVTLTASDNVIQSLSVQHGSTNDDATSV